MKPNTSLAPVESISLFPFPSESLFHGSRLFPLPFIVVNIVKTSQNFLDTRLDSLRSPIASTLAHSTDSTW